MLDKIIEKLPDKEKTMVGENGSNLSGGQIQRIAMARALLKDAKLLLFDEAISHMDVYAREEIKQLFKTELAGRIALVVDHINDFDDICNKKITL